MGTVISKIEYYLPETILDNDHLAKEYPDWSAEKIESKVGIRNRHVVREDETALDLAVKCGEKILADYDKGKVDFLILCTQSPEYYLPTSACILQDKLGLSTGIGAFDINLGCSGYIYGLAIAKGLISAGVARCVLLFMSETYTKHIHPKDRANRTIFGDAAAGTIVEKSDEEGILKFSLGTDGRGYKNLIIPNGGLRNRYDPSAGEISDAGSVRTANHLYMNGPEIFNFTIEAVPKLVSDVLLKNALTLDQVDYVIFHQANKYMLEYLKNKIKIPKEKFYINMVDTGNTVSATIPIALKQCLDTGLLQKGQRVLLIGFGVGYSFGGCVVRV
jgi:3-oxoacyl-[acyl-carrier-protein] synthase-3